jgi:hypothetical protein
MAYSEHGGTNRPLLIPRRRTWCIPGALLRHFSIILGPSSTSNLIYCASRQGVEYETTIHCAPQIAMSHIVWSSTIPPDLKSLAVFSIPTGVVLSQRGSG